MDGTGFRWCPRLDFGIKGAESLRFITSIIVTTAATITTQVMVLMASSQSKPSSYGI
jgi:hypothetical protein